MTTIDEAADRLAALYEDDHTVGYVDLDEVVRLVKAELPDVYCYVEQTGGGCATVYLGDVYLIDRQGRYLGPGGPIDLTPGIDHQDPRVAEFCVPVMAGPGWFEGRGWTKGRAHRDELSVGYECNDPVAEEEDRHQHDWNVEGPIEPVVAATMVQLYRDHPRRKAGEIP